MICEVCTTDLGSSSGVLDLGSHPLCDDLVSITNEDMSRVPRYEQKIVLCQTCLTAHQAAPVKKELLFKRDYKYRSSLTQDVIKGMANLVEAASSKLSISDAPLILDVGCNDGSLLGLFKQSTQATTVGVDPTDAIQEGGEKIDHKFQSFFDVQVATQIARTIGIPDLITFTNVFAHIEDLPGLIKSIDLLMGPETILVVENHYLGSILSRNQFDTFYHEHPRTYSAKSFDFIAKSLGASVSDIQFPSRYGGNIRVFMSKSKSKTQATFPDESSFFSEFINLQANYDAWLRESRVVLKELLAEGPLIGKGLPGRAVMLISSLGLTAVEMPVVYEQDKSPKVAHFVPGTDIVLKSDASLPKKPGQKIIIWPWHIAGEVCEYLESLHVPGDYWVPLPKWTKVKSVY